MLTTGDGFQIEFDSMDQIFQKILNSDFSDFKGLTIDASIPVPQDMINEIIEAALEGNRDIEYCQVSVHAENRVSADLKTRRWPWPLNLRMRLFRSVDFTASPKIRAFLENNMLLGKLGSMLNVLPNGVKLYGDQIVLDLEVYLHGPELKKILDLVQSMEIKTEEGKAIFAVKLRVEE